MKILRKRTKLLWKIGIPCIRLWIRLRYDIKVIGELPKPPYLLLSNHSQNVDPFFILAETSKPVSFVINNAAFQNPVIGLVLRWIDSIPTQKSSKDAKTVMRIFHWIKDGRIVGIFPEGHATWDGESIPAVGATAKLLNRIKIPIVTITIKGGYLVNPRWATYRRKGKIEIHIGTFEDEQALEALKHSDWQWQEETGNLYRGKNKAVGIEKIMWFCPECGSYRGIHSIGDKVVCRNCTYKKNVNEDGRIGDQTVKQVLDRQRELLKVYTLKKFRHEFRNCRLKMWGKGRTLRLKREKGTLIITDDHLKFNGEVYEFQRISGLNTYVSSIVEFICDDNKLVRIKTKEDSLLITELLKLMGV
ncbi:MAG TPA: lysophospholipid acyltransferase family protein [Thermotogota bacterium]|nr:lysophospholipid acyltransferase family protein [Thermotogota bacterium]HPJ87818.1 lysophospholipid acyltransferase family protein [Thermotogota bacterium]